MKARRAVRARKSSGKGLRRAIEAMEREAEGWLTAELRKAEAARDRRHAARVRRALTEIQARREARAAALWGKEGASAVPARDPSEVPIKRA